MLERRNGQREVLEGSRWKSGAAPATVTGDGPLMGAPVRGCIRPLVVTIRRGGSAGKVSGSGWSGSQETCRS